MLQRLGIRGKLLLVVAVPTIVLLLASGIVVFNAATSLTQARNTSQLVQTVEKATPLIEQLQAERNSASNYLRALNDGQNKRLTARSQVNTAFSAVRNAADGDPVLEEISDQLDALWAGADDMAGIEAIRGVAEVAADSDDFPQWPDADAVATLTVQFGALAANVERLSLTAPAGPVAENLTALPDLLRTEAEATASYLNDAREYALLLPDNYSSTDAARSAFSREAGDVPNNATDERVYQLANSVMKSYANLDDLRIRVRNDEILPTAAAAEYSVIIDNLLLMEREVGNTINDQRLAAYVTAHASVQDLVEAMRSEEIYVDRQIRQRGWLAGEYNQFQALYFASNAALDNARRAVEPLDGVDKVGEFGASFTVGQGGYESIRNSLLDTESAQSLIAAGELEWPTQVEEELAVITPIRTQIFSVVKDRAAELERTNLIQTVATLAIGAIVVTASLLLTQAIARRIINPLRRLTTTATAVRQELPRLVERVALPGQSVDVSEVQIPVESQDEVGRLAEAFNSVNAATLSIAAEQAALRGSISEMFVNVARRDQVLLNRQLASIDEMERTQDDPDTLTKLFALDHLATRMRRNSESLLVLAGIDTGRRLRRPMPLSDVIRTASSEIELYERVVLELDADPAMLGHSALTAAHLFAELLENATVFSDPGSSVVVRTVEEEGSFVVTITDSGIGMSPEELAEANSRVASTAASEILGAQRLGLFVVGRIARRVGARVYIESAEGKGTKATIVMPPSLFDLSAGSGAPVHAARVADESVHAPTALVNHTDREEPAARGTAYTPATIQEGTSLRGRDAAPAEASPYQPAQAPEPTPTPALAEQQPAAVSDSDSIPLPAEVAQEFDGLPSVTEVGLPTRRRKSTGQEAPQETGSIIGLPQRASEEQLSALAGAATTGFTPILAVEEVSAESAQLRSRVFRGFRSTRDTEAAATQSQALPMRQTRRPGEEPLLDEVADSASDAPYMPVILELEEPAKAGSDEPAATSFEPGEIAEPLAAADAPRGDDAPDEATEPVANIAQPAIEEAEQAPVERAEAPVAEPAVEPEREREVSRPISGQSPLISRGFDIDAPASGSVSILGISDAAPADMIVPQLEDDDEPPFVRPASQAIEQATGPVDKVSLEDDAPAAAPVRSPLYPAPAAAWQRPAQPISQSLPQVAPQPHQQPYAPYAPVAPVPVPEQVAPVSGVFEGGPSGQAPVTAASPERASFAPSSTPFVSDPVTSTPSLDELILEGARVEPSAERSGFFSKLFGGKPRRPEPPVRPVVQPGPVVEPAGPLSGTIPVRQEPVSQAFQPPAAPIASQAQPATGSNPALNDAHWQAAPMPTQAGAGWQSAPQERTWDAPVTTGANEAVAPISAPMPMPAFEPQPPPQNPFSQAIPVVPQAPIAPAAQGWEAPVASAPTPVVAPQPIAPQPIVPQPILPQAQSWEVPEGAAHGFDSLPLGHMGSAYSPDQLAKPLGWEAAGASALQAAAPEVATEYRPLVQIDPEPMAVAEMDLASAVFSELSSLAAERPNVQKTRAGLAKRTPVQKSEVAPIPEVVHTTIERNADEVRSRFSAFYSATRRNQSEVSNSPGDQSGRLTQ